MAQPLSSVVVDFRAGFANLEKDLANINKKISSGASQMQSALSFVGKGLAFAGIAMSVDAFASSIQASIDKMDNLGKAATRVGMSVKEFSKLDYAAKLAGIENVEASLGKLNKNITAAMGDVKGAQADMFRDFGINLKNTDGSVKTTTEVLMQFADFFNELPDGAVKSGLAMMAFGKSGADMLNLFKGGAEELNKTLNEVGGTTAAQAKAAEDYNDNWDRISAKTGAFSKTIANELLPAMIALQEDMLASQGTFEAIKVVAEGTAIVIKGLAIGVYALVTAFSELVQGGWAVVTVMKNVTSLNFGNIVKDWNKQTEGMAQTQKSYAETVDKILNPAKKAEIALTEEQIKAQERADALLKKLNASAAKNGTEKLTDFQKALQSLNDSIYASNQGDTSSTQVGKLVRDLETGKIKVSEFEAELLGMKAVEADLAEQTNKHNQELDKSIEGWKNLADPTRAYRQEVELMAEAYAKGKLSAEELAAASKKLYEDSKKNDTQFKELINTIEGFGRGATDTFVDFVMTGKASFTDLINSMIKDLMRMLVYKNIFKPMFASMGSSAGGMFGSMFASASTSSGASTRDAGGTSSYSVPTLTGMNSPSYSGGRASAANDSAINIIVNVEDNSSKTTGDTKNQDAVALGKRIEAAVKDVLVKEKRAGGLLSAA